MQWVSSVVILFDMCLSVRVREFCCFCCCCCDEYSANHWCWEDFIVSLLTSHGRRNNMLKPWIKFNWSEKAAKKNWQKKKRNRSMKYRRQDNGNNHCTFSLFIPLALSHKSPVFSEHWLLLAEKHSWCMLGALNVSFCISSFVFDVFKCCCWC